MLITSFKQNLDLYTMENNPFIFNAKPTLVHVKFLFIETRFVAGWATPLSSVSSSLPSRYCWPCLPRMHSARLSGDGVNASNRHLSYLFSSTDLALHSSFQSSGVISACRIPCGH